LYEVSIAFATLAAIVAFWFTKDSPRDTLEQLVTNTVIDIDSRALSHDLDFQKRQLRSWSFGWPLVAFWVLGLIAPLTLIGMHPPISSWAV
jgi:hypothetical protein